MLIPLLAVVLAAPNVPQVCEPPPARDVSELAQLAKKSGAVSVGLDSVATWCFDSGGAWTGGHKLKKGQAPDPEAIPSGDCAKAIGACEGAKVVLTADLRGLLYDTLAELEIPFLGVRYTPKRSGLSERPAEVADCRSKIRSELFAQAQARMDIARLANQAQSEYRNFRTWLYKESLACAQRVARGEKDPTRKGIAIDTPVVRGGGEQQVPGTTGGVVVAQDTPGGVASGGTASGGTAPGGTASGGTASGGTPLGGTASGGTASGGTASGGTPSGGTAAGGTASGGTAAGCTASGGTASGGTASGGTASGGTASGATASGGTASGGTASGGTASGGTASGGTASGGTASGGTASGGTASGASAAAGTAAGVSGASRGSGGPPAGGGPGAGAGGGGGTAVAGTSGASRGAGGTEVSMGGGAVGGGATASGDLPRGAMVASVSRDLPLGGPTQERQKALASSMIVKWRYLAEQRSRLEPDPDWALGFLASRELRDCRCQRVEPKEIVLRLEAGDRVAALQADDEKNTRCELCLQDAYAPWKARVQRQCAQMDEFTDFELGVLQRSDDGNGLPPRCFDASRARRAAKGPAKPAGASAGTTTTTGRGGTAFIITKTPEVEVGVAAPVAQGSGSEQPSDYAPVPPRESGRVYYRVFMSRTCVAEIEPGPIQARTGDLMPVPPGTAALTVKSPCGGLIEVYFGKEEKPRVTEVFGKNQPLRLQFKKP